MAPTIRVDDEVFGALQRRAQPFVDSPNDVLRHLLRLSRSRRQAVRRSRAPVGSATPQPTYRPLILQALAKAGGSAPMQDVLRHIEHQMNGRFTARDVEHLTTGAIVWQNKAQWERHQMVTEGLLKSDSPRGIWELTAAGWQEARRSGVAP